MLAIVILSKQWRLIMKTFFLLATNEYHDMCLFLVELLSISKFLVIDNVSSQFLHLYSLCARVTRLIDTSQSRFQIQQFYTFPKYGFGKSNNCQNLIVKASNVTYHKILWLLKLHNIKSYTRVDISLSGTLYATDNLVLFPYAHTYSITSNYDIKRGL